MSDQPTQYQEKNRTQHPKNHNPRYSDDNNSQNKQGHNFRDSYKYNHFNILHSKNQNHYRQSNGNYSHNYYNNKQNNYRYTHKQRDQPYYSQSDSITYDQKHSVQSENQQQTNKDLFQQNNQDSKSRNQIKIGDPSIQNQQLQEIEQSKQVQVSKDIQGQSIKNTQQSQNQISGYLSSDAKEISNSSYNETITNVNAKQNDSNQNNKQLLGISQQQLIQQKQIPLLVQFLILPNDTTSQPQLIPLTLQNLTQTYEQLKLLIQNDDQQQS
ncbi:unnamed protein product (macronuclear) [Paramecium tetraurelia]|uniref:Uncharacterized protein n=1 Tax=Paramecium tetraurelia TaxID=5888 RepID=A0DAI2_PARTE|nr:uncharacterized protein GSPATT00014956001 [Paramecium tetraurelia]CAK80049.1 unnamed protein product [Paramecium tetraurelia]|eukprot:XP_001447446.1 hypothetical protein (macronuclear) [Paramecium tetraurelia strain d4-2]